MPIRNADSANSLLSLINEVVRLQSRFEVLFAKVYSGSSLSTLQKLVLSCAVGASLPLTVPQIGRNLGRPRQVIQRAVNDLVHSDLIRKVANPDHKRAALLVPTEMALEMKRQIDRRATRAADALLSTINSKRCAAIQSELRELRHAIEAYTRMKVEHPRSKLPDLSMVGLLPLP